MDDPEVTISVALAFYNSRPYLREQLDSILAQTRPPDQIVVGDDGSSDGGMDDVLAAKLRAEELGLAIEWTILEPTRVGLQPNKVRICDAATGDVIVFCDSDDVCLPDRFERVAELFASDPQLLFLHTDAEIIGAEGELRSRSMMTTQSFTPQERAHYAAGESFRVLIRRFVAHGAMTSMRRSLFESAPPLPPTWHLDAWYALLAAATGHLAFDDRPSIKYRMHGSNSSGGVRRRGRGEKLTMLMRPGGARNEKLLVQARSLMAGIDAMGDRVIPWARDLAAANLKHEEARSRFPKNRVLRAPFVLREATTGAYARLARGRKDVLLDLLQPTD
ncbi:MAG: putative glycosyltransferase [Naasia sp.]|jgi:glycosyltransferase involved in cell wall biosynthesis|uniref:glycosyltransferase n=1 Tax=Naasia sp. TaxID=2546198 RepID=UPI002626EE05|nr:glycosyltransferase [Naasia sp.]MCU1570379.1 putative glycosyltransferase [Naasia sp.]